MNKIYIGWSREEAEILVKAVMRFGVGNWREVMEAGCLPGKTNAQLNLQLQRLLGQQSTAEFQGLHIDPLVIGNMNALKQGPEIKRKNGFIVNTGDKITKEDLKRKIQENKEKYELPESEYQLIELPRVEKSLPDEFHDLEEKKAELSTLKQELKQVQEEIAKRLQVLGLVMLLT